MCQEADQTHLRCRTRGPGAQAVPVNQLPIQLGIKALCGMCTRCTRAQIKRKEQHFPKEGGGVLGEGECWGENLF